MRTIRIPLKSPERYQLVGVLILLSMIPMLCFCLVSGKINAYLEDTDRAVNSLVIGNNKIVVEEEFESPVKGEKTVKKPVAVNTGSIDCYVRGRVLLSDSRVEDYLIYYYETMEGFHNSDWKISEDGWLYYQKILKPEDKTSPVFTHIKLEKSIPDHLLGFSIDVIFESVQTDGFLKAEDAFSALTEGGRK